MDCKSLFSTIRDCWLIGTCLERATCLDLLFSNRRTDRQRDRDRQTDRKEEGIRCHLLFQQEVASPIGIDCFIHEPIWAKSSWHKTDALPMWEK